MSQWRVQNGNISHRGMWGSLIHKWFSNILAKNWKGFSSTLFASLNYLSKMYYDNVSRELVNDFFEHIVFYGSVRCREEEYYKVAVRLCANCSVNGRPNQKEYHLTLLKWTWNKCYNGRYCLPNKSFCNHMDSTCYIGPLFRGSIGQWLLLWVQHPFCSSRCQTTIGLFMLFERLRCAVEAILVKSKTLSSFFKEQKVCF